MRVKTENKTKSENTASKRGSASRLPITGFKYMCLFVCLFVCSITKMNDPKVFKLGIIAVLLCLDLATDFAVSNSLIALLLPLGSLPDDLGLPRRRLPVRYR